MGYIHQRSWGFVINVDLTQKIQGYKNNTKAFRNLAKRPSTI